MKMLVAILISVLAVTGVIDNIATINRLKKEAEQAYKEKDYATAINRYNLLLDSLNVEDENIRMNLAHAYLMSGDTATAQQNYGQMIRSDNQHIKSLAYQQLGVISSDKKQYKEALSLFKESLKADPANDESRYDYELVKKLFQEQQQQQNKKQDKNQDQQNKDQQQKDQQQKNQQGEDQQQQEQQKNQQGEQSEQGEQEQKSEEQGQEGEEKPEQPNEQNAQQGQEQQEGEKSDEDQSVSPVAEKLKEMNISEEKARMILDAMRNNEMQYIQQNRRKSTQARDRSKPDW